MSGTNAFHPEVLNDAQRKILPALTHALSDTDFYLAGGTALALQIGHRPSVDFDWFAQRIGEPETLLRTLKSTGINFTVQSINIETIYLTIGSVQTSFIGYDYPLLNQTRIWPAFNVTMAGTDDIACMKLAAVTSRGSRKDFLDLYFLISNFRPLGEYLHLFAQKYQTRDIGHVVRSLVYFNDADAEPEIRTTSPIDWGEIKRNFEKWVIGLTTSKQGS